jgi:hypothetical protein
LIDNVIKFGHSGGHFWIDGAQLGTDAVISIKDDGIGIPPEQQEPSIKLFELIDRSKLEQQGVGLGLSIAASLAQFQSGSIQCPRISIKAAYFRSSFPWRHVHNPKNETMPHTGDNSPEYQVLIVRADHHAEGEEYQVFHCPQPSPAVSCFVYAFEVSTLTA